MGNIPRKTEISESTRTFWRDTLLIFAEDRLDPAQLDECRQAMHQIPAQSLDIEFALREENSRLRAALEYIVHWNGVDWSAEKASDMARAALAQTTPAHAVSEVTAWHDPAPSDLAPEQQATKARADRAARLLYGEEGQ